MLSTHLADSLTDERMFDLCEQVSQWLDFQDALTVGVSQPLTPRRIFRAMLSIQVARAVASMKGAPIRMDPGQTVFDAFWHLCPPSDR